MRGPRILKSSDSPPKPHILQVIQTLGPGGAERLLLTYLSQPVLKENFRHTVVMTDVADTHAPVSENFLVKALEEQGVRVIGLGLPGSSNLFKATRALCRLIRSEDFSVIHTHLLWANLAGRLAGWWSGVPVISSFHNPDYDSQVTASFQASPLKQDLIRRLDGWTTRHFVTKSVAVSKYVACHIESKLSVLPANVEVIYNPVDARQVQPGVENPRELIFGELGLNESDQLLIFVGRLTDQKGVLELIDAFARITDQNSRVHLAVIGSKTADLQYVKQVQDRIAQYNLESRVHLTNARQDVASWLAAGDLFLFPTKFEGMGIALAEAMAAGLPCIATKVGPIPELIRHGETGFLVEPGDIGGFSSAMMALLSDAEMSSRISRNASEWVSMHLEPGVISAKLYHLYNSVLSKNSSL